MSSIKMHLATRDHRLEVPFIELCRTCWTYIINLDEWRNVHTLAQCRLGYPSKQIRGPRVLDQWQDLYINLCPESERLPSPCKL